jgi:hypothetical protein
VLSAEHLPDFAALDNLRELTEAAGKLRQHILTLACPFDEHTKVVGPPGQGRDEIDLFLDATAALENLLGFDLVAPEIRSGRASLYSAEFLCGTSCLKDSSGDRRRAWRDPDTCGSIHQY